MVTGRRLDPGQGVPNTGMIALADRICSAIARQEGWWHSSDPASTDATDRPQKLNNPGDLRSAPWLSHPIIESGYWHAASPAQGISGLYHQVCLNIARGMTLRQLINAWAPASDGNKPTTYLANVMVWTGIPNADQPLQELLELTEPRG